METTEQDLIKGYETETCSRCGGTGHYSYNQIDGTRCFKCSGAKNVYTKRGTAARAYARSLLTVKASEVQVGWLLWVDRFSGCKAGWHEVESICTDGSKYGVKDAAGNTSWMPYTMLVTCVMSYGFTPDSEVKSVPTKDRLLEVKALALAYQATLTKQGKPSARKYEGSQVKNDRPPN